MEIGDSTAHGEQRSNSSKGSTGWQTSLLRSEIFAHGHYGERAEPEAQRLLTPAEFQQVLASMTGRYSTMPPQQLRAVPNLVSLLYGWKQAARNNDAKRWVEDNTQADEELLAFLSRARSWSANDAGVQYLLKPQDLSNFLDYDTLSTASKP